MKAKILLIEDNIQNRYMTCFLLEHRGHEVKVARTGPDGLLLAAEWRPDLILLDIQLPGMTGYDVARHLRSDTRFTMVPVVAVTSYAMPGDRERCLESGATGYIEKPIDPDTFVAKVEGFLRRAPPPADAGMPP